jgi:hypothetical protein
MALVCPVPAPESSQLGFHLQAEPRVALYYRAGYLYPNLPISSRENSASKCGTRVGLMNLLRGQRTYLFGQMEYMDGSKWRDNVEAEFKKMGIIVFNPYKKPFIDGTQEDNEARAQLKQMRKEGRWEEIAHHMKKVKREDFRQVEASDFLFGYINMAYQTVGSWDEIFYAEEMEKPIFLIIEGGLPQTPLWLFGRIPIKYIYSSIEDAVQVVKNVNDGTKKIDSERWRIFKPEYVCTGNSNS